MLTLRTYLDESGTNPNHPALVIAGFISDEERWEEFSERWHKAVVEDWGLPFWHMTDFAQMVPPYDWGENIRRARLGFLLELIEAYALAAVGVAFPRRLFNRFFVPKDGVRPSVEKETANLYAYTAWACLEEAAKFPRSVHPELRTAIIYEAGARGRHHVAKAWQDLEGLHPETKEWNQFLSLTFAPKEKSVPLQAADILAYEMYRDHPRAFEGREGNMRYPFRRITEMPLATYLGRITEDFIRRKAALANRDPWLKFF